MSEKIFTDKMLTVAEVAKVLNVDRLTAIKIMTKQMPGFKVGREWRVFKSDLPKFIAGQISKTDDKK